MPIVPYLLLLGGYGFSTLYEFKGWRQFLRVFFWITIWLNAAVYVVKVGGRGHGYRMYNRVAQIHDPIQQGTIGAYAGCYLAPQNILMHGYGSDRERRF